MICFVVFGIWLVFFLIFLWISVIVSLFLEKCVIVFVFVNVFGNFFSVYGSWIWFINDLFVYYIGFGVIVVFFGMGVIFVLFVFLLCKIIVYKGIVVERVIFVGGEIEE